jgi:hypothetical protein
MLPGSGLYCRAIDSRIPAALRAGAEEPQGLLQVPGANRTKIDP